MSPRELKPFQTECRGPNCGTLIWMMPIVKANGEPGWGPMDPDPDLPNEPPEEWVKAR